MSENEQDSSSQSRDDVDRTDHKLMLGKRWGDRAEENIENWGNQPAKMLLLAMAEEMAEVADELLEREALPPNAYQSEAHSILNDIRTTGYWAREYLEEQCENEQGDPLPPEERASISGVANPKQARDETEDIAPLCWQLYWALDQSLQPDTDHTGDSDD